VVLGSISIHLAANTVDDVYDFESQVDVVSNNMFPPDFGGWKVLPRGLMSFGQAKFTAYLFFILTIIVGLYLTLLTGPFVLLLGAIGLFFAYFHVAPPLRLGYRGLGLSELGILLSFGILPVVGCFYVQAGYVSPLPAIVGLPLGCLTTTVLINHDQIFFDAYKTCDKKSYTVTVGRRKAVVSAFANSILICNNTWSCSVAAPPPVYGLGSLNPPPLLDSNPIVPDSRQVPHALRETDPDNLRALGSLRPAAHTRPFDWLG
jgi:1,4-dihydroxy-2-naphthoate octaprenyltransferase